MPLSCAKALAPTMALLGWTLKPVIAETSRDAFMMSWVTIRLL